MPLSLKHVPAAALFVSWFGNKPNTPNASGWTDQNWLKSRFHFNFAEYRGGRNNLGCLRVVNDDFVQPARQFGTHGHAHMEIATYVLDGRLTHKDSICTTDSLGRGGIQFMSAGKGIQHSEENADDDKGLRFIQTWISPRTTGGKPNYGGLHDSPDLDAARDNKWSHLISDLNGLGVIQINQDCNLYVAVLSSTTTLEFAFATGRQGYAICVEGSAVVNGLKLDRHEAFEVSGIGVMKVKGQGGGEKTHVMVFEMKA